MLLGSNVSSSSVLPYYKTSVVYQCPPAPTVGPTSASELVIMGLGQLLDALNKASLRFNTLTGGWVKVGAVCLSCF